MVVFIGFIATLTSTISLLPQLYQTYKSKKVEDLSIYMLINFIICSICWMIYGFLTNAMSVLVTNVIMTICSIVLLIFKIRYSKNGRENN